LREVYRTRNAHPPRIYKSSRQVHPPRQAGRNGETAGRQNPAGAGSRQASVCLQAGGKRRSRGRHPVTAEAGTGSNGAGARNTRYAGLHSRPRPRGNGRQARHPEEAGNPGRTQVVGIQAGGTVNENRTAGRQAAGR